MEQRSLLQGNITRQLAALAAPLLLGNILQQIYLRVISLFYVFNDMGSILMGWFRGTGHVAVPVVVATLHITLRVVLSRLWVPVMGLAGVALASGLGWMLAVSTLWLIRRHVRQTAD